MGMHSDDMLDGLTCQECGMFMQDFMDCEGTFEAPGYPRTCAACEPPRKAQAAGPPVQRTTAQQEARRAKNKGKRMRNKANRAARALAAQ